MGTKAVEPSFSDVFDSLRFFFSAPVNLAHGMHVPGIDLPTQQGQEQPRRGGDCSRTVVRLKSWLIVEPQAIRKEAVVCKYCC